MEEVISKICRKKVPVKSTTATNLKQHLHTHHPQQYRMCIIKAHYAMTAECLKKEKKIDNLIVNRVYFPNDDSPTCDCLSKLFISFVQDADKTHNSARIYKCCFVVGVLIDEVAHCSSGVSQHSSVITGEELNQSWDALQITDLAESNDHNEPKRVSV